MISGNRPGKPSASRKAAGIAMSVLARFRVLHYTFDGVCLVNLIRRVQEDVESELEHKRRAVLVEHLAGGERKSS
jgi:hypothetical protein